jgi:phosphoribosyl-AMP cyclohydrolase
MDAEDIKIEDFKPNFQKLFFLYNDGSGCMIEKRLMPVVILGFKSKELLMDEEAYQKTVKTGLVNLWSRTRKTSWLKGETSGNKLRVIRMSKGCEDDAIAIYVEIEGSGNACHIGNKSCFYDNLLLPKDHPYKPY